MVNTHDGITIRDNLEIIKKMRGEASNASKASNADVLRARRSARSVLDRVYDPNLVHVPNLAPLIVFVLYCQRNEGVLV